MTANGKAKGIAILGSTGSIGCNTLRVIESLSSDSFRVVALGAGHNVAVLADQIAKHLPELVSVETEEAAHDLRARLFERDIDLPRIIVGEAGLIEVATHAQADCVVSATVGAVGFVPTLRALEAGKRVALANKETLVMAGELMTRAARASGAELLPVDSDTSTISFAWSAMSSASPLHASARPVSAGLDPLESAPAAPQPRSAQPARHRWLPAHHIPPSRADASS